MTEQAEIRRLQDTLTIAGNGVIAFSVWPLAKIGLFLMLTDEDTLHRLLGIDKASLALTVYLSLGAILLIDLAVRAFVGLSARAEGQGKRRSPFYLVVAVIAAMANASSLVAIALSASSNPSPLSMIVSIAIEATTIIALALVVYSSIRLRHMSQTKG